MNLQAMNDGIVIFSDVGNVMFTSTGKIVDIKKAPRKHKINRNIIHENFNKMREINDKDNEFWDRFLYKCARNIFPSKDFKYTNDILYYKIKTKKHRSELYIDGDNLEKSFIDLKKFMRAKGIKPNSEVREKEIFFEKEEIQINVWKDIKGVLKFDKIFKFINLMSNKFQLNYSEMKQLESLIKVGISGDLFNNDNIIIDDNNIVDIKYLNWLEKERKFELDINNIPIKFSKTNRSKEENRYTYNTYSNENNFITNEIEIMDISKKWQKFLDNFFNKN